MCTKTADSENCFCFSEFKISQVFEARMFRHAWLSSVRTYLFASSSCLFSILVSLLILYTIEKWQCFASAFFIVDKYIIRSNDGSAVHFLKSNWPCQKRLPPNKVVVISRIEEVRKAICNRLRPIHKNCI